MLLYIDNLRSALKKLSEEQLYDIAKITRGKLIQDGIIKDTVRPAHVESYLKKFIDDPNNTTVKYLNGYLKALDEWQEGFALEALAGGKIRSTDSWRNILIKITKDVASENLIKHKHNQFIMKELKTLFINTVESCVTEDQEETLLYLRTLNRLLDRT